MVTVELGVGNTAGSQMGRKVVLAYKECTVGEFLEGAGVDLREVGMVLVNKKTVELQTMLGEDDHIQVLPMLCGG